MAKGQENSKTIRASFDISTTEGKMKVFNAQNGASISLKKLKDGEVIDAVGIIQYEDSVDGYGKDGQKQDATITVIFGADGNSYAGVSNTVADAGDKLLDFLSDTGLESFKVKVIKSKSASDREFLNLQLVM